MKKLLLVISLLPMFSYGQSSWYDNDWQHRIQLSTNPSQVGDDVTDYVAYVDLSLLSASFLQV